MTSLYPTPADLSSSHFLGAISFALLFYDYLLTLDLEISRYWGSRFSWPTVLFFINRYGALLGNVPVIVQKFWSAPESSALSPHKLTTKEHLELYHQWFVITTQILIGVMLIFRTYALYERNRTILILMLLVGAGVVAACIWGTIFSGKVRVVLGPGSEMPVHLGCTYTIIDSQTVDLIVAWASMAIFDSLIFFLTLYKALSQRYLVGVQLLHVLLRDGSIYFGVVVVSNLCNIMTFIFGGPFTRGVATTFTNIISSIMISRLMLNIRDPSLANKRQEYSEGHANSGEVVEFSTCMMSEELSTPDSDTADGWI
ncbi:hypothetical protein R3P38DRAFT_3155561 [Favolaschia claudopus]|uniref:DUF6533 domain-containing protein n=1 Tax=Favolaschia claudopus TaxID=2862362 RepID=A0AAV9YYN8_9AGAR